MYSKKVLFIDDDRLALACYGNLMSRLAKDITSFVASNPVAAEKLIKDEKPQVVVLDLCLEQSQGVESGFKMLQKIIAHDATARVIVLTGHSSDEYGVRAIQNGAASFLAKPVNHEHLLALIQDGVRQSDLRRAYEKMQCSKESALSGYFSGASDFNSELLHQVEFAVSSDQPVLITGETGTGKGYVADLIHRFGRRRDGPFVSFQPILHSPEMVASELFGHERGAFTGAENERKGIFLNGDKGTVFLDEIDCLPLSVQSALLGVLQTKKFRSVGCDMERSSDFRLLAATNRDPEIALKEGKIRSDLFFRIAHFRIHLEPLRRRREDIRPLALSFLAKYNQQSCSTLNLSGEALRDIEEFSWPGNIRELEGSVYSAAARASFSRRSTILRDDFRLQNFELDSTPERIDSLDLNLQINNLKSDLVRRALKKHNNSQVQAAKELGIDRGTLKRIIDQVAGL